MEFREEVPEIAARDAIVNRGSVRRDASAGDRLRPKQSACETVNDCVS